MECERQIRHSCYCRSSNSSSCETLRHHYIITLFTQQLLCYTTLHCVCAVHTSGEPTSQKRRGRVRRRWPATRPSTRGTRPLPPQALLPPTPPAPCSRIYSAWRMRNAAPIRVTWFLLVPFGRFWSHLVALGSFWSPLVPLWSLLVHYGPF